MRVGYDYTTIQDIANRLQKYVHESNKPETGNFIISLTYKSYNIEKCLLFFISGQLDLLDQVVGKLWSKSILPNIIQQYCSQVHHLIIKTTMKDLIGNHTSKQLAARIGSRNAFHNS